MAVVCEVLRCDIEDSEIKLNLKVLHMRPNSLTKYIIFSVTALCIAACDSIEIKHYFCKVIEISLRDGEEACPCVNDSDISVASF